MTNETNASAFTCKRVWEQGEPVFYVSDDSDGDWQFLCGGNEHTSADEAVLIHAKHMFDLRPDLRDVEDLALGFYTWRASTTEPWQRYELLNTEQ